MSDRRFRMTVGRLDRRNIERIKLWPLLALLSCGSDCGGDCAEVNVDDVYWNAWRQPETFDSRLQQFGVGEDGVRCLQQRADENFEDANSQRKKCAELISYSDRWNACHDEADLLDSRGQVFQDIANAVQGVQRFDESVTGQQFAIVKAQTDIFEWNALIDAAQEGSDPVVCCLDTDEGCEV